MKTFSSASASSHSLLTLYVRIVLILCQKLRHYLDSPLPLCLLSHHKQLACKQSHVMNGTSVEASRRRKSKFG